MDALTVNLISPSAIADTGSASRCMACHGVDGKTESGRSWIPNLAAQNKASIVKQTNDYASGNRKNATMEPIAKGLTDQEIDEIAAYYSSLPALELWANPESIEMGKYVYEEKITAPGFPSCIGRHGENGIGNSAAGIPKLSGQNSSYLYAEIIQFMDGSRNNSTNGIMKTVLDSLTKEEISALTSYLQGLQ